jgi:hypothetical protein
MFSCKDCNKIYTYKANYIRHMNLKHNQTYNDSDFIIIDNNHFNPENNNENNNIDKDLIIYNLKKQISDLTLELNTLKENKNNDLLHYFINYKTYTYCGLMLPSKYNKLFFRK